MNIQEATKKAVEINGYMVPRRENPERSLVFIKPTNETDLCKIYLNPNENMRRWQPSAELLISDEWSVVSEKVFLALSGDDRI